MKRSSKSEQIFVWKYSYQEETDQSIEIKVKIGKAGSTFMKIKHILARKNLDINLYVRLIYGVTSSEALQMLKISWRDKVTNEEVLRRISKEKNS